MYSYSTENNKNNHLWQDIHIYEVYYSLSMFGRFKSVIKRAIKKSEIYMYREIYHLPPSNLMIKNILKIFLKKEVF